MSTGPEGRPPGDVPQPSPEELVREARAGSESSYAALIERFQRPLYQYLRLRLQSAGDAEELVHETFVRAWRNLDRYDETWRVSTWLFTIARREAVSFLRRRHPTHPAEGAAVAFDPRPEPMAALVAEEGREALWDLARRLLSGDQFDALWLRYAEDLTPREIAQVHQRDASAVRVMLFRARQSLAHHLRAESPPTDDASAHGLPRANGVRHVPTIRRTARGA
jgi:RNA polymerase sigma-70 factor (ECF subfamily)